MKSNVMKTVPISGTLERVSFFEDDTIETVRQYVSLAVGSHPDRLFIQVKGKFPADYYSTNPKRWTDLFYRLAYNGKVISLEAMRAYITETRSLPSMVEKEITLEEWEAKDDFLQPLYNPDQEFEELRILGVDESRSMVFPLPPKEVLILPNRIPLVQPQSLYETFHPYEVTEIRVVEISETTSELIRRIYFPMMRSDTPNTVEPLRSSLEATRTQFEALMELPAPKHETTTIVRAKWYIPFVSTRFPAPRARFEQIFYGMTLSPGTPYIGYFTAKTETLRHKFYVEDPKTKEPILSIPTFKRWLTNTLPQRRKPTLLIYRGKTISSFDRIAVTDKDIVVDVRRDKTSTASLEELQKDVLEWLTSLDALIPFLVNSDIDSSRWELNDLSVVASYHNEVRDLDMHRFPCIQSIFGYQNDAFRLLRSEHTSDTIPPQEVQAYQILSQEDAEQTPEYLSTEMNISIVEASELIAQIKSRAEDFDIEKSLRAYPIIKFTGKDVIVKFVTSLERTLKYADILRFVLTSDSDSVNNICPRRMDKVLPTVAVTQQEVNAIVDEADDEFNALLGITEEEPEAVPEEAPVVKTSKKVKVTKKTTATYNYFNTRLQKFDAETFDKSIYPSKCDKPKQVIALTPEDQARIGPEYNFADAPETETLKLENPEGTVICPPYWCMRDEIPLREDQLVTGEDGALHCPVCDGKIRPNEKADTFEFTVIKRDTAAKYPDFMKYESTINKRRIPCCYQQPRSSSEVLVSKEDETYILKEDAATIPSLRLAYLPETFASKLQLKPSYAKSVKKGRLVSGQGDVFRVGIGRPSKTFPKLLGDDTIIKRPNEAKENIMRCSFFRTWKGTEEGSSSIERTIASIDSAYTKGELTQLDELEYVTTFLKCEVIRLDMKSSDVHCGFWSELLGANSRTIALIGMDVLAYVERKKEKKVYKTEYTIDLRKTPFKEKTLPLLRQLHTKACSLNVPVLADAVKELRTPDYQYILDPFDRIQAVFVPGVIVLPIQPTSSKPPTGAISRNGYANIELNEIPEGLKVRAFLSQTIHPGFKVVEELQNSEGEVVELLLASGFRVPIQPEEPEEYTAVKEVLQTIQKDDEIQLVEGDRNKDDLKTAKETEYKNEIYEFLLFSLSKDIQTDDFAGLRDSIQSSNADLYKEISAWFKAQAYSDKALAPIEFINKVRTPCGQFDGDKSCNKSSLCGWHKGTCKIKVNPVVDTTEVLKRIAKTLKDNGKQRALVLDDKLSPFFSTILYLEMPHEWITNVV